MGSGTSMPFAFPRIPILMYDILMDYGQCPLSEDFRWTWEKFPELSCCFPKGPNASQLRNLGSQTRPFMDV